MHRMERVEDRWTIVVNRRALSRRRVGFWLAGVAAFLLRHSPDAVAIHDGRAHWGESVWLSGRLQRNYPASDAGATIEGWYVRGLSDDEVAHRRELDEVWEREMRGRIDGR